MLSAPPAHRRQNPLLVQHTLPSSTLSFQHTQSQPSLSPLSAPSDSRLPTALAYAHPSLESYMSEGLYLQNPAIRLQQSTPVAQYSTTISPHGDLSNGAQGGWGGFESDGQLGAHHSSLPAAEYARGSASHQRAASASSIASSASGSSYGYNQPAYSLGPADYSPPLSAQKFDSSSSSYPTASRVFSNNLPTPTHTPTQDSFTSRGYPTITSQSAMPSHLALKQEMFDKPTMDEELPGFSHSAHHSVSSFANSPSTPHTVHEDVDDRFKVSANDLMRSSMAVPDDLFATNSHLTSPQVRMQRSQPGFLSPYSKNQHLQDLLHEANKNRSASPSVAAPRSASPFLQTSQYAMDSPSRMANSSHMRSQPNLDADALAASTQGFNKAQEQHAPKTISPKDVQLEYNDSEDNSKMPLFPDEGEYPQGPLVRGDQYGNSFGMGTPRSQGWMATPQSAPALPQTSFNFTPTSSAGSIPNLSFSAPLYRPELTPDFPAHLTSMESSGGSDAGMDTAPTSAPSPADVKRPESTMADAGTYSCTYHGCMHRFDSPQKLQKHKREGHRQNPPMHRTASPAIGSNMSSAALLARNSQAGPHKCERTNPTTGKPCNTIFSRPYDLTRHEDTIHNGRKQKVRCALCVEEKSFSRNDALTRHMRVVHPEVDFPGKHRRRGAE